MRLIFDKLLPRSLSGRMTLILVLGLLADMGHLVMYHAVPDLMGIVLETVSKYQESCNLKVEVN